MTAKPKTSLKIVDTAQMEAAMASAPEPEVVPTVPVVDEALVYRAGEQLVLDKVARDLWIVESEIKAAHQQFEHELAILKGKRDAALEALGLRESRLHRIKAGCEAALKASED